MCGLFYVDVRTRVRRSAKVWRLKSQHAWLHGSERAAMLMYWRWRRDAGWEEMEGLKVIPRSHDEASSTSWLYERSQSQLVEPASSCKRGISLFEARVEASSAASGRSAAGTLWYLDVCSTAGHLGNQLRTHRDICNYSRGRFRSRAAVGTLIVSRWRSYVDQQCCYTPFTR